MWRSDCIIPVHCEGPNQKGEMLVSFVQAGSSMLGMSRQERALTGDRVIDSPHFFWPRFSQTLLTIGVSLSKQSLACFVMAAECFRSLILPASQRISFPPIITIVTVYNTCWSAFCSTSKLFNVLSFPWTTQNKVHLLHPDIPLSFFSLNSCQTWFLIGQDFELT